MRVEDIDPEEFRQAAEVNGISWAGPEVHAESLTQTCEKCGALLGVHTVGADLRDLPTLTCPPSNACPRHSCHIEDCTHP